ncbi:uncharacterized protein [Fopius arisanus]|uniref:WW domain-containing protein n=1 Tax=Fopius arisanus TaxID=64838 RepID=A0A9R1U4B8_9HYME|nr:PREDICTED: uncharacterized protein LOC105268833 [Fopius arisanus]
MNLYCESSPIKNHLKSLTLFFSKWLKFGSHRVIQLGKILDYAKRLGINPDTEPHLLDLAREGLMAALPDGWRPCFHEPQDAWYYYHAPTETTTWEHPLDAKYKELVEQARAEQNPENKMNLREIVKRSESMSPRYEKDWEQLSHRFSSEENIIDIDKLSVSSLTRSDSKSLLERPEKEINQSQSGNQKELLLNGGGSMFLKSTRSRDNTPNQDGGKFHDFHISHGTSGTNDTSDITERPKSILREKPCEDDDRHTEEERKSVRFDLEKGLEDMKFMYSGSEDNDRDSDSNDKQSSSRALKANLRLDDLTLERSDLFHINVNNFQNDYLSEDISSSNRNPPAKLVGRRFLVQNVSEVEHMNQLLADDLHDERLPINKFTNIKNIDLIPNTGNSSSLRDSSKRENQSEEDELSIDVDKILPQTRDEGDDVVNQILIEQEAEITNVKKVFENQLANRRKELEIHEERELAEMEVGLHRTRSLLGEKIIHLRHSEQSLERVVNAKRNESQSAPIKSDELTLSDMSSASSGFSSTDFGTDTFIDKPDQFPESTEIIASLENLNSEIREIWGVLNKRQGNNIPPPPTLSYSDLGYFSHQHVITSTNNTQSFGTPNIHSNILSQLTATLPSTTTQNIITQYGPNNGFTTSVGTVERGPSNLMERTRNMRDWLRQARMESTDPVSPGEATL